MKILMIVEDITVTTVNIAVTAIQVDKDKIDNTNAAIDIITTITIALIDTKKAIETTPEIEALIDTIRKVVDVAILTAQDVITVSMEMTKIQIIIIVVIITANVSLDKIKENKDQEPDHHIRLQVRGKNQQSEQQQQQNQKSNRLISYQEFIIFLCLLFLDYQIFFPLLLLLILSLFLNKYHAYLQQQKRSDRQHAQEFWDGFQWVKKTDTNPQAAPGSSFGISGDPSRNLKIHVTGLPTDLGITAQDVRQYFNSQILENHPPAQKKSDQDAAFARLSSDQKQLPKQLLIQLGKIPPDIIVQKQVPVVEVQLMPQLNAATIQFSEPKMTSHAKQLNGNKILGQTMRIHGFADQIKFQNKHLVQLAAQRGIHAVIGEHNVGMNNQTTATATALALAAVKGLQGNDVNINMQALGMTAATSTASKIIKIFNLCDRDQILPQNEYNQIKEDMLDEMEQFKGLIGVYVVKPGKEKLGSKQFLYDNNLQKGSVFIQFDNVESAQSALNLMKGRTFDDRRVKAIFIPQELWNNELKQH